MKHLRKYNESLDNFDDIVKYIKLCFVEFSDEGKYDVEYELNEDTIEVLLFTGYTNDVIEDDINHFLKISKKLHEFYLDIEVAIKRVLDEYPDLSYVIGREFVDYDKNNGKEYIDISFYHKDM